MEITEALYVSNSSSLVFEHRFSVVSDDKVSDACKTTDALAEDRVSRPGYTLEAT